MMMMVTMANDKHFVYCSTACKDLYILIYYMTLSLNNMLIIIYSGCGVAS